MEHKRRILPPVWLVFTILAEYILHRWLPLLELVNAPWKYSGVVLILLGIAMAGTAAQLFKRAATPVIPFERSTALVTTGWFRYTRNPMYMGMVLVLAGIAITFGSLGAWLPIPVFIAIIRLNFIRGEERFLEEIFGEDYRRYKLRVRRWL
jgi:protein-S-isoprenylcysteine O-methyltransferase Ste14